MPKRLVCLVRSSRDMALDIVSYGRRGPGGTLRFGQAQIDQIQRTVDRTPEVMVKVSGGGRDTGGVGAHLRYIGRHGKLAMETDEGLLLQGKDAAKEITSDWQLDLCRSQYRPRPGEGQKDTRPKLVHNIVLSMPAGTPPAKVLAAARVFARENFALQHRYAMVLHTDQAHPHVHLVVKCEHEFEPGRRLYIRKETLRQWREQFAALMREQGVAANATPRQLRGQTRVPLKDPIHQRLCALRAFSHLPPVEPSVRRPPKPSAFMRAKLQGALEAMRAGRLPPEIGQKALQSTRAQVEKDWRASAEALRRQGHESLAAQIEQFVQRMPVVRTDVERIAERWREESRGPTQQPSAPRRAAFERNR